jgi:predicted dehydrogenase
MEVEDSAAIILRLENGSAISLSLSWSLVAERDRHYMRLLGTRGSGSIQPLAVFKEIEHGCSMSRPNANLDGKYLHGLLPGRTRRLRGHGSRIRPAQLPFEQVELMRLVGLAYQSAREQREVDAR